MISEKILTTLFAFVASFIFGLIYRFILKQFKSKKIKIRAHNNIGKSDKIVRATLGAVLLVAGLYTNSFLILFFSGFCFFEVIFSWCGFYAITGKNSFPVE